MQIRLPLLGTTRRERAPESYMIVEVTFNRMRCKRKFSSCPFMRS